MAAMDNSQLKELHDGFFMLVKVVAHNTDRRHIIYWKRAGVLNLWIKSEVSLSFPWSTCKFSEHYMYIPWLEGALAPAPLSIHEVEKLTQTRSNLTAIVYRLSATQVGVARATLCHTLSTPLNSSHMPVLYAYFKTRILKYYTRLIPQTQSPSHNNMMINDGN